jgi:D-glycero-alpha-D-manno-heptose-7-phosphate kinase|tara:strand:- start:3963 stop:4982 length:1020 start_codon:yes stop_codon:yes gene_type:complete
MKTVFSKAPLRLAMSGGGTDLQPYWSKYGGVVLNGTIDQYAYCKIEPFSQWSFKSVDLGIEKNFFFFDASDSYYDGALKLLVNTYQYLTKDLDRHPVKITTYVEAPPGSGLGSSSALVVALVSAIAEYYGLPRGEYDIAEDAIKIERSICNLPGGKQDQFASAFGGFNFMEFLPDGRTIVNPLRLNYKTQNMMELNTVLYYVGKPRKDANVILNTTKNLTDNKKVIQATHKIKETCIEYKNALLTGDFNMISKLMNTYWKMKMETNENVASPELIDAYNFALQNGATGAKISGAGGGGHMILFTDFDKRHQLITSLENRKIGKVVPFKFVKHGVDLWRS